MDSRRAIVSVLAACVLLSWLMLGIGATAFRWVIWRDVSAVSGGTPDRAVGTLELVLDVVLVVALRWVLWVLWVTAGAEVAQVTAASGSGRPGVMVIDGLRPARGADIPVGTFTERDGTVTSGVAWQDRPASVGDRKEACAWGHGRGGPGCSWGSRTCSS